MQLNCPRGLDYCRRSQQTRVGFPFTSQAGADRAVAEANEVCSVGRVYSEKLLEHKRACHFKCGVYLDWMACGWQSDIWKWRSEVAPRF